MKKLIIFSLCMLMSSAALAQDYYLVNKATGKKFGPFSFLPGSEVRINSNTYTVSERKKHAQKHHLNIFRVKVLQLRQQASFADLVIKVTNQSKKFIGVWQIGAAIYDRNGNFRGYDVTNGNNLQPGNSVFTDIYYGDVNAYEISKWIFKLEYISAETESGEESDATKHFKVEEVKK